MSLNELLIIMQNRLITLQETRKLAVSSGNLEQVINIDNDITTTQLTVQRLNDVISSDM